MEFERVYSRKRKRSGLRCRFRSPLTGRPTERTYWVTEPRLARKLHHKHIDGLEAQKAGVPVADWGLPFEELVSRFVAQAPISSHERRALLKRVLERNELGLAVAADLNDTGRLTARARKLIEGGKSPAYVVKTVQRALKQLSRWAFRAGILPTDPLLRWDRIPGYVESRHEAYQVEEVQAILAAAKEWDGFLGRRHSTELILRVLPTAGNRPGAVLAATVGDLQEDRIKLPPGNGKKLNGACTLPPELVAELRLQSRERGAGEPLLLSSEGNSLCAVVHAKGRRAWRKADLSNVAKRVFQPAAVLAFVREAWPNADPNARECEPVEVASAVLRGHARGFDGPAPKDPVRVEARRRKLEVIEALAARLEPHVEAKLKGRPFYAFCRHTHETLASGAGVHPHAIDAQMGHKGAGSGEAHYLTVAHLNPAESSRAVYDLITGRRNPDTGRDAEAKVVRLAAGAENQGWAEAVGEASGGKTGRRGKAKAKPRVQDVANEGVGLERATGVGPATFGLGSQRSTTELRPLGRTGSGYDSTPL